MDGDNVGIGFVGELVGLDVGEVEGCTGDNVGALLGDDVGGGLVGEPVVGELVVGDGFPPESPVDPPSSVPLLSVTTGDKVGFLLGLLVLPSLGVPPALNVPVGREVGLGVDRLLYLSLNFLRPDILSLPLPLVVVISSVEEDEDSFSFFAYPKPWYPSPVSPLMMVGMENNSSSETSYPSSTISVK